MTATRSPGWTLDRPERRADASRDPAAYQRRYLGRHVGGDRDRLAGGDHGVSCEGPRAEDR